MNYTEEQYSELYNNLPKGLRDLVLTGALSAQVGALALKYNLTPEEQSELEPAIEDVALGLITPEELAENIFIQVGIDDERAQGLAGEAMRDIYGEYLEELRLTRKYKIELDERIRKEEGGTVSQTDGELSDIGDTPSVAGNIINITRQQDTLRPATVQDEKDKKVADWFTGKKSPSGRAALDALGEDFVVPSAAPVQKVNPPQQQPSANIRVTTEPTIPAPPKPKNPWEQVTAERQNSLKPVTDPSPSPSKSIPLATAPNRDFDKSLVQVEQQIFTLTQAVNKMIEQNAKTINPVVQSVFNGGQFEEVSRRMDAMNHRIDDLQSKLLSLMEQHKKDVTNVLEKRIVEEGDSHQLKPTSTSNIMSDVADSAVEQIIKIKKEVPITQKEGVASPTAVTSKPQSFTSSVTKNALDGIFQTKKESAGNSIAITKSDPSPQSPMQTTQAKTIPDIAPISTSRNHAREQLLKEMEMLKQGLQPSPIHAPQAPQQPSVPKVANALKEEIAPYTETDKMKALQDKIKSLNKGITQGGIVSAGTTTDPYRS